MTKNIKFLLSAFLISFFFTFSINLFGKNLEDFFFLQEITKNPQLFLAQLNPVRDESLNGVNIGRISGPTQLESENLEIQAESAFSVLVNARGEEKIIFEKESDKILPIASLTKLMAVDIVLENFDLSQTIEISQKAVSQEGDWGNLKIGEKLSVENLLYMALIESSNDAAYALTEIINPEGFIELMNLEARYLDMANTHFEDVTGISSKNQSNTVDLVILTKHLLALPNFTTQNLGGLEKPLPHSENSLLRGLIWEILRKPEFDLILADGVFHHKLINTNQILQDWDGNFEIIGGKTGYTHEAKGCLLLVLKTPKQEYLINVILGSEDRFGEMKKIIDSLE